MIYFVVALEEEFTALPFKLFLGEEYKIIYTGVGKVNACLHLTEAVLQEKPSLVINIGTAGTPTHKIGDVLICNEFIDGDLTEIDSVCKHIVSTLPESYERVFKPRYSVTTKDTFSHYDDPITSDAADMESFALARVCDHYSLPFVAIKIITDIIGQTSLALWEEQLPRARETALKLLTALSE